MDEKEQKILDLHTKLHDLNLKLEEEIANRKKNIKYLANKLYHLAPDRFNNKKEIYIYLEFDNLDLEKQGKKSILELEDNRALEFRYYFKYEEEIYVENPKNSNFNVIKIEDIKKDCWDFYIKKIQKEIDEIIYERENKVELDILEQIKLIESKLKNFE